MGRAHQEHVRSEALCATGRDAKQESGLSAANPGNLPRPGDLRRRHRANLHFLPAKATSIPFSLPWQLHGPTADTLLHAGTQRSQLSPRARVQRWRDTRLLPDTPPHPATALCLCQNKPFTPPCSDPCPPLSCLHLFPLPCSACLLLPSPCSCLQRSCLQPQGWVPRGTFGKANRKFWKWQGMEELWAGEGVSLRVQTAGLVLSFFTCSPAPSWHKGTR